FSPVVPYTTLFRSGLPELLGVHLTETLVALDHDVAVALPVRVETLDDLVALLVGVRVVLLLAPRDPVQRRLRDVDHPLFDELPHVAEEEGEEERADVGAVHVRVGHDDDLVVPRVLDVELVLADPGPDRGDDGPDLLV